MQKYGFDAKNMVSPTQLQKNMVSLTQQRVCVKLCQRTHDWCKTCLWRNNCIPI